MTKERAGSSGILGWDSLYTEAIEYIRKHDIIGLTEKWLEGRRTSRVERRLKEFDIISVPATRVNKKGRAKGGLILGVNKRRGRWEKVREEEKTQWRNQETVTRKLNAEDKCTVVGVTYMRERRQENWKLISGCRESNWEDKMLIGGDFNARTGKDGGKIGLTSVRNSKDQTVNEEGKGMIEKVEEMGMMILNGNCEGDWDGEFTFTSERGKTVIDYVICDAELEAIAENLKVESRADLDHCALVVTVGGNTGEPSRTEEKTKQVKDWSEKGIGEFKEKCAEIEATNWSELKEKISEAAIRKTVREDIQGRLVGCRMWGEESRTALLEEEDQKKWGYMGRVQNQEETVQRYDSKQKGKERRATNWRNRAGQEWKKFWEVINRNKKGRQGIHEGIKKEEWVIHFKTLLEGWEIEETTSTATRQTTPQEDEQSNTQARLCTEIKKAEVLATIRNLKKKKAAGPDGIGNEEWIEAGAKVTECLTECIDEIWKKKMIPEEWKKGYIFPIFKKGNKEDVKNYRGIILMDSGYKIYVDILRRRLETEMAEKGTLDDTQFGFRGGRGTIDAIYTLKHMVRREISKEKGRAYIFAADLKSAFDKVERKWIWERMKEESISEELFEAIQNIYKETRSEVIVNGKVAGGFKTERGVRQGCPMSPTLFNVCFANLEKEMRKAQEGGIVAGKLKIWTISNADDIVLMANNETGMKEMLKRLEKYLRKSGLQLNVEKSKMMVCKKSGGRPQGREGFKWKEEWIETVK